MDVIPSKPRPTDAGSQPVLSLWKQCSWLICRPVHLFENARGHTYWLFGVIVIAAYALISFLTFDFIHIGANAAETSLWTLMSSFVGRIMESFLHIGCLFACAFLYWIIVLIFQGRASNGYWKAFTVVSLCSLPDMLANLLNQLTGALHLMPVYQETAFSFIRSTLLHHGNPFLIWNYVLLTLGFTIIFRLGLRRGLGFGMVIYFGSMIFSILFELSLMMMSTFMTSIF